MHQADIDLHAASTRCCIRLTRMCLLLVDAGGRHAKGKWSFRAEDQ
jgi:hypothetical protein